MPYFTKKPVKIEARQWEGTAEGATPLINWILDHDGTARYVGAGEPHPLRRPNEPVSAPPFIVIDTLEGAHRADYLDWIVKGVQDEFYPIKPDIFAKTYEEVSK